MFLLFLCIVYDVFVCNRPTHHPVSYPGAFPSRRQSNTAQYITSSCFCHDKIKTIIKSLGTFIQHYCNELTITKTCCLQFISYNSQLKISSIDRRIQTRFLEKIITIKRYTGNITLIITYSAQQNELSANCIIIMNNNSKNIPAVTIAHTHTESLSLWLQCEAHFLVT